MFIPIVLGPNSIAKASIDPRPDGQYAVTYIPVEVGLFNIQVKWNGKEIPGKIALLYIEKCNIKLI